jgi:hypothetical protein
VARAAKAAYAGRRCIIETSLGGRGRPPSSGGTTRAWHTPNLRVPRDPPWRADVPGRRDAETDDADAAGNESRQILTVTRDPAGDSTPPAVDVYLPANPTRVGDVGLLDILGVIRAVDSQDQIRYDHCWQSAVKSSHGHYETGSSVTAFREYPPDELLGGGKWESIHEDTSLRFRKYFPNDTIRVALVPDPGKVHHGFDPPNPEEGDSPDEPYWASVVQGGVNDIINLHLGSAAIAEIIECRIVSDGDTYVDIDPKQYQSATTKLTLMGTTDLGDSIYEPAIQFVLKPSGEVLTTLQVMVLPQWSIPVGVYTLEDPSSSSTAVSGLPSWSECIAVCNDVFMQAGVSFTLHNSSGARFYPYDTRGFYAPELPFLHIYDATAHLRDADGALTNDELEALTRSATVLGTFYPAPSLSLFDCTGLDGALSVAVVNAGAIPYSGSGAPYVRGVNGDTIILFRKNLVSNEHLALAIAHEIGHNLQISTANGDRHDLPPYADAVEADLPNGVPGTRPDPAYGGTEHLDQPEKVIMASGSPVEGKLPWLHGRWMRNEDWDAANTAGKAFVQ